MIEEDNDEELLCRELEGRLDEEDNFSSYASMDEETSTEGDEGLLTGVDSRKLELMIVNDEIQPLDSDCGVRERSLSHCDAGRGVEENDASSTWVL